MSIGPKDSSANSAQSSAKLLPGNFEKLPREIRNLLLQNLSPKERAMAAATSKFVKDMIDDPNTWKPDARALELQNVKDPKKDVLLHHQNQALIKLLGVTDEGNLKKDQKSEKESKATSEADHKNKTASEKDSKVDSEKGISEIGLLLAMKDPRLQRKAIEKYIQSTALLSINRIDSKPMRELMLNWGNNEKLKESEKDLALIFFNSISKEDYENLLAALAPEFKFLSNPALNN